MNRNVCVATYSFCVGHSCKYTVGKRVDTDCLHVCRFVIAFTGMHLILCGPGSSVGIATGYELDGPGIESRWGARFSAPVQTAPGAHPASCTMGTRSFPRVKCGQGVLLTTTPF